MVASVIAMVASMAIFQTYASNEERRRTTTSGGEGLQAGLFALATIERAITNAGYNLTVVSDPGYTSPVRLIDPGAAQFTLSTTQPAATRVPRRVHRDDRRRADTDRAAGGRFRWGRAHVGHLHGLLRQQSQRSGARRRPKPAACPPG